MMMFGSAALASLINSDDIVDGNTTKDHEFVIGVASRYVGAVCGELWLWSRPTLNHLGQAAATRGPWA